MLRGSSATLPNRLNCLVRRYSDRPPARNEFQFVVFVITSVPLATGGTGQSVPPSMTTVDPAGVQVTCVRPTAVYFVCQYWNPPNTSSQPRWLGKLVTRPPASALRYHIPSPLKSLFVCEEGFPPSVAR